MLFSLLLSCCLTLVYFVRDETKSSAFQKVSNESTLDFRVVLSHVKEAPDLCISEFAKQAAPWKYYYDKTKAVVASIIHWKKHISRSKLGLEEAMTFTLPFMICEGLETDIYGVRLVSEDWCVVEKIIDIDLPCCVADVKDGKIAEWMIQLRTLKVL